MKISRTVRTTLLASLALLAPAHALFATTNPVPPGACLYALDPTADRAFQIAGAQSVYSACGIVVESSASDGFEMEGSETLYLQNHSQVSVVGGAQLNGQTKLWDTINNSQVQAVQVTSPGDPLASIAAPTTGMIVGRTPTYYDMNSKPTNNTLSPGVYCGGLTIGNTNGTAFTMSPGVYIIAGGGLVFNSQASVSGSGVTIYNTSSSGWGCASSYNYTPVTISGQVTANLSAPTTGSLAGILFFGNRTGCPTPGACQDQINGGSTAILNGALYFKSDQLTITGSNASGYMMLVADKIYINGNSNFGTTGDPYDGIIVSISPATASLNAGQTQQFTATVNSANSAVTWSVSGAGTVSSAGLYTAPATVTTQQTVTLTATSQDDTSKRASASITLYPPVTVSVSPSTATLYPGQTQQFAATVTNSGNTAVIWSVSGAGKVSSSGLYTAPASVTAQQSVTVTATSQANSSKAASATITLMPPVAVSVSPTTATLYGGQTQQFAATVINTSNTAVTWSVSGVGAISSIGLYTAPASVTTQQTVTVTATSQASSTAVASSTITLLPPVSVSINPSTATLYGGQTQQFAATVTNTSNTAVTWTLTGAGTVSSTGLYTAPSSVTTQQTVTITATSQATSAAMASATITLYPPVAVSLSPTTATLYGGQTQQFAAAVTNAGNSAVTWSVTGAGTVSSTGLYTAPASVTTQQTVTVTATSQASSTAVASATIALTPPVAVSVSPTTGTLYAGQTQQFSAAVVNSSNTAVTWTVSGTGTVNAYGLYAAPATVTTRQTVTVTATSQTDPTISASATVTLEPPVAVSVNPAATSLLGGQTQQFTASVLNTTNMAVTWSLSGAGTISGTGLYAAPATVATQQAATVTATSQADPTQSASATITLLAPQCATGPYNYYRAITVDHTRVPNTDQTDYPMLVSGTYPFLAGIANGGQVQNPNGFDIIFTADSAGQVPLDFEIDSYNFTTGSAAFWVRIPMLSHTLNTTIYMWYGDPNIATSQENKSGVWRNNYLSVYHFGNGASGSPVGMLDSGSLGYNLAGSATAVSGMFGGGAGFSGDSYTYLYNDFIPGYPSGEQPVTLEAWTQLPANTNPEEIFGYGENTYNGSRIALAAGSNDVTIDFENIGPNSPATVGTTWHYIVGTYDGGNVSSSTTQLYMDGVALPLTTTAGAVGLTTTELKIGGIPTVTFCCGFAGSVDEVRISSGVRSPDWVATEFNNESSPSTFYTVSSQNPLTVSPASEVMYSLQTQQFTALAVPGCTASGVVAVWSISPAGAGTITSSGLYKAPANNAGSQTVTIIATSPTNSALSGSATVTLLPPPVVTVSPLTATLHDGQTEQFTAAVTNAIDTAVTWTVSPASAGSISAGGLFTATASTSTQQTVTITATSQADPTQSGSATITLFPVQCAATGFDYQRLIKINHNKVANSDQTNFPVLISGTYPFLATVANGGRLQNANGYDVVFTSDFAGQNALDYEIDNYNPATGAAAYWVRIPTLSHTTDTAIYMWYGNPSVVGSLENKAGVWSANYAAVWHFGPTNAISTADSTANANNGINHNVVSSAGLIGGSGTFDGSGNTYFDIPSSNSYKPASTLTLEAWVNMAGPTHFPNIFSLDLRADGSYNYPWQTYALGMFQNSLEPALTSLVDGDFMWTYGTANIEAGQWTHIVGTYDGQNLTVYANGVVTATSPQTGAISYGTSKDLAIGVNSVYNIQNALAGLVDEARISTVARSQDWIVTEYNNQSSPAVFFTVFPESTGGVVPGAVTLYGAQSQQFLYAATCNAAATAVWSMPTGSPGTLSTTGLYTAPATIQSQQTVTITGTTLGVASTPSTAIVTLMPPVSVTVAPFNVTLTGGQTQQFTANVTNTANTAVTWSINPAGLGAITPSGLYTAPAGISAPQTVLVTATSVWDTTQSATLTTTLLPAAVTPISPTTPCGSTGYSSQRSIVIDHTKVPNTDQTDFPFLFNTTDPTLATTGNGGQVVNTNGYDIFFSTDPNGQTALDYEMEQYNAATGQVVAWIRIPTLSHVTDTVLYVFYGNPNIAASLQNPAGVWGQNYQGVYHLGSLATGSVADSSIYANTGQLTAVSPTTGLIASAGGFDGATSYLQLPSGVFPSYPTGVYADGGYVSTATTSPFAASFGAWFKTATAGSILGQAGQTCTGSVFGFCYATGPVVVGDYDPQGWADLLYVDTNGTVVGPGIVSQTAYNDNNWHYAALTFANDGTDTLYVDGKSAGTANNIYSGYSPSYEYFIGTGYTLLGYLGDNSWFYFGGTLDEVSIANTVHSADWIQTEYNNQGSPGTFYSFAPTTLGMVVPSPISLYAAQTQQFSATGICSAAVTWSLGANAAGTISPSGLYNAPPVVTSQLSDTVTATSQSSGSTIGSSVVTLLPAPSPLTLVATAQSPYPTGTAQSFVTTVRDQFGTPQSGVGINFSVNGANASYGSATTDRNGNATFTYTGTSAGSDTIQSTAAVNGNLLSSNAVSVAWTVASSGSAASVTLRPEPALGVGGLIGAFTDSNGSVIEPVAIGSAATTLIVPAGAVQLQLGIDDDYFEDNGGAGFQVNVNGTTMTVPPTAMPWNFVTGALNNNYQYGVNDGTSPVIAATNLTAGQIVSVAYQTGTVSTSFPALPAVGPDGDPTKISGGTLYEGTYFPTLYTTASSYPQGQPIPLTAVVTDATGAGVSNVAIILSVSGVNPGQYQASTDATGTATFAYIGANAGSDTLQLQAAPSGSSLTSNTATVVWTNFPTPPPVGSLALSLFAFLNEQQLYSAFATDAFGNPATDAGVGFFVSGVDHFSQGNLTDITGHSGFSYFHLNGGNYNVLAVESVGRNVTLSNVVSGVWTPPTSTNTCPGCDSIGITITAPSSVTLPNVAQLSATVADLAGLTPTVAWSQVSGPGSVTFSTPQQLTTTASFSQAGNYALQLAASDAAGSSNSQQITIQVVPMPIVGTPQQWGGTPLYGATVTGLVPITLPASVTLQSGTLSVFPVNNTSDVMILNANTTGTGQIGTFDTTTVANGSYWIELQATQTNGTTQQDIVLVTVEGNYKPGRVTTNITDLIVPATGLAISIGRQYDSLNAGTSGDFGYGWNLSTNVNLTVDPANNVTFTLGGQRRTFYFTPQYLGATFFQLGVDYASYTAEPGLAGTLTPQLDQSNCPLGVVGPDGSLWVCSTGALYSPLGYTYTDAFGTQYAIGSEGSLQSITDRSGNALTVNPAGISSSTGLSVPFTRDSSGRITQITDPQGNNYLYTYDANGNLATVTYPSVPQPSTYTYAANHLYAGGTDFRSNPLPVTTYDANGRVQSVTDALGETTSYAYDLTTNTTVTTNPPDANGTVGTVTTVYDSYGMVLSVTDPLGLTTTNTYDANHNLASVTDPLGHVSSYTYDPNDNQTSSTYPQTATSTNTTSYTAYNRFSAPTSSTDELGNVRTFSYDANYNPQSVTDAQGTLASFIYNANGTLAAGAIGSDINVSPANASQYTYDAYGNETSKTDALGRVTSYTWDTLGRRLTRTIPLTTAASGSAASTTTYAYDTLSNLIQTAAPLGRTTSSTYNANGNKVSDTDPLGNVTTYQYDSLNRLTTTTYPTQPATTTGKSYDFRNNLIDETDQAGHVTHHVYDLSGRQTSVTRAYGTSNASTTTYTYDNAGRKITEADALGHTTAYMYDPAGNVISIAGVKGTFTYAYDNARNKVSSTDGNGNTTQFQFDSRQRLTQTLYPDGTSTTNTYDGSGNLASVTDQAGKTVQYSYDAANQLASVVQLAHPIPAHNTNSYAYDDDGNLTVLTDENGHSTVNTFDLLANNIDLTLPDRSLTETRGYDPAGNLLSLQHFNGKTTTYMYDPLDRLSTRTPDPSLAEATISYAYTPTGKHASTTDASGTTTYVYDSLDRQIAKITPEGTLNYTFDAAGNVASIMSSNPNGASMNYTYDNLNRLSTVIDNRLPSGQNTTTYAYDTANNLVTATYPNGLTSTFHYDPLNRLTSLASSKSSYGYQLGATGNRIGVTESTGRTANWTYNGIYQLTSEAIASDPSGADGTVTYGLDPVGNRLSANSTVPNIMSSILNYTLDDELTSEIYDANGNAISVGGKTFGYDSENRLTTMNGGAVGIVYDGFGNRVAETANGVTTKYLVEDDVNPTGYPQVMDEIVNGAVTRTYTYGSQRISQNQVISGTWTPSFFGYDGAASVRQLTNLAGAVTDTYTYDAYGNLLAQQGTTPNNYLYRGEQYDPALAVYSLRARYYNPATGRFLSRDPLDGKAVDPPSLHKYLYADGDPVNRIDPMGQEALIEYVQTELDKKFDKLTDKLAEGSPLGAKTKEYAKKIVACEDAEFTNIDNVLNDISSQKTLPSQTELNQQAATFIQCILNAEAYLMQPTEPGKP